MEKATAVVRLAVNAQLDLLAKEKIPRLSAEMGFSLLLRHVNLRGVILWFLPAVSLAVASFPAVTISASR